MMTKHELEREETRFTREAELKQLALARANADPKYTAEVAGFWLSIWKNGDAGPQRNFRMRGLFSARIANLQ